MILLWDLSCGENLHYNQMSYGIPFQIHIPLHPIPSHEITIQSPSHHHQPALNPIKSPWSSSEKPRQAGTQRLAPSGAGNAGDCRQAFGCGKRPPATARHFVVKHMVRSPLNLSVHKTIGKCWFKPWNSGKWFFIQQKWDFFIRFVWLVHGSYVAQKVLSLQGYWTTIYTWDKLMNRGLGVLNHVRLSHG